MNTFLTRNELAEKLKIDIQTVDRERRRNPNFPNVYYIGSKLVRFKDSDVQEYIESMKGSEEIN